MTHICPMIICCFCEMPKQWRQCLKGNSQICFTIGQIQAFISCQLSRSQVQTIFKWLESNRGPLELEATALPTEPQPLSEIVQGKFTLLLYVSISDGHILIFQPSVIAFGSKDGGATTELTFSDSSMIIFSAGLLMMLVRTAGLSRAPPVDKPGTNF